MSPNAFYVGGPYTASTRSAVVTNVNRALAAGEHLSRLGHFVIVPHAAIPPSTSWDDAMVQCKRLLLSCSSIVLLPGWETSRGARMERVWAENAGLAVYLYSPTNGFVTAPAVPVAPPTQEEEEARKSLDERAYFAHRIAVGERPLLEGAL